MPSFKRAQFIAPLAVAILGMLPQAESTVCLPAMTQVAVPGAAAISGSSMYGSSTYTTATPFRSRADDYYSGAHTRPRNLNCWFGNGYDW
jgi:hypothetical protein